MLSLAKNKKRGIHQFILATKFGDAITNDACHIREILRERGFQSDLYADEISNRIGEGRHYKSYRVKKSDIIIYHFATKDEKVIKMIKNFPNKKVLIYHNITPGKFFEEYDEYLANEMDKGREVLRALSSIFDLVFTVSSYNARDLRSMGFRNVKVIPILYDFKRLTKLEEDPILAKQLSDKTTKNIVFVGRIVQNKRQEDVINAFYLYHKYINKRSRLFLIGSHDFSLQYRDDLRGWIKRLKLKESVHMPGLVTNEEWASYYKNADLFLSMSEHEGFFVPALECMYFKVPMLLYKSCAVPETAGDAAIYFTKKKYEMVAEMMDIMMSRERIQQKLVKLSRKRLEYFKSISFVDKFMSGIEKLMA